GKWVEAKELPDIWTDLLIVSKGDLKLPLEVGNFPAFLEKYPIEKIENGYRGFDDKIGYCGEPDIFGVPQFKETKQIKSIFDIKRTASKIKDGIQLGLYCNLFNLEQGIIIPLNDKTQSGFSKPIIYDKKSLEGYYKMGLEKRESFRRRYGI
ncbi:hypothetical protein LCGC14_1374140, partial [marine sediment metagenome]